MNILLYALQEGGAHEGGLPEWVPQVVNLLIFLSILFFVLRKPMTAFFETRRAAILAELEKAKRQKEEAEEKLAKVEDRLAKLASEQGAKPLAQQLRQEVAGGKSPAATTVACLNLLSNAGSLSDEVLLAATRQKVAAATTRSSVYPRRQTAWSSRTRPAA